MENNLEKELIDKLKELNEIEQYKSRILTTIFIKTTHEIKKQKVKSLKDNILSQAEFYNQNIDNYTEVYTEILNKYTDQLSQIIKVYTELFINIQMELQEAECNQKIAITNLKKSIDLKNKMNGQISKESVEKHNKKIEACMQKKLNYDIIIENCEKELEKCSSNMLNEINMLFGDKSSQISLREEKGLKKFINKLFNKFIGSNKFIKYVITPTNIEVETMNNKLPKLNSDMKEKIINFVAKIKQAKDETNKIFEKMII